MVALRDDLLPEELDVLARVGGREVDVAAMLVVQNTYRAASALRARLEARALTPEDLTWSSFTMLFCLWVWGPNETRRLADLMGVAKPTVSGVTDTLERRGLVERRRTTDDRRLVTVALTARGRRRSPSSSRASTATRRRPAKVSPPTNPASSRACCASSSSQPGGKHGRRLHRLGRAHGSPVPRGAADDGREVWLGGERVGDVVSHPQLGAAARAMAGWFDFQHEHAGELLMPSPKTGLPVGVSHMQPRSREDLIRRRKALKLHSTYHGGLMGRSPDYLNVTFALFAARADIWAQRGNERGAENVVRYHELMRDCDLSTTHTLINPQVDRSRPDAEAGGGEIALHKVGESAEGIVVRGARMLATLAPFADELSVYPGSPLRLQDSQVRAVLRDPDEHAGAEGDLARLVRQGPAALRLPALVALRRAGRRGHLRRRRGAWDRVFLDGDTVGHDEVITKTNWRTHIVNQAMIRAWTKLELAFGVAHRIADATGVNSFDHVQEKLGEIWTYARDDARRHRRLRGRLVPGGGLEDWAPDERPFVALRGAHAEVAPARIRAASA